MKTVENILAKFNLKPLKSKTLKVTNSVVTGANNKSKQEFSKYCAANGFTRLNKTNSFIKDGVVAAFSVCGSYVPECRQFAEHYSKLVCMFPDGSYKEYDREELNIYGVSRIGPDGVAYNNVKGLLNSL